MTPAVNIAKKAKINHEIHEYAHDASTESYGLEAAEKLAVPAASVFKTLVVKLDSQTLAVAVIPVSNKLSMKRIAKAAAAKKATMASPDDVQRSTGYVLGGVSPLGQKKRLKTFVDRSAIQCKTMFVSAGRRGLDIELNPEDLVRLVNGVVVELCS